MGVTVADLGTSGAEVEVAALAANEGERGTDGSGGGAGVVGTGVRGKTRISGSSVVSRVCVSSAYCLC